MYLINQGSTPELNGRAQVKCVTKIQCDVRAGRLPHIPRPWEHVKVFIVSCNQTLYRFTNQLIARHVDSEIFPTTIQIKINL